MQKLVHTFLCTAFFTVLSLAQTDQAKLSLAFPEKQLPLSKVLETIEDQSPYFCSYNPQQVDINLPVVLDSLKTDLETLVLLLSRQLDVTIDIQQENNKIIILSIAIISISGTITDSYSSESLQAVAIYKDLKSGTYSNEDGYYSLKLAEDTDSIYFSYLGYQTLSYALSDLESNILNVNLESDNLIKTIVISDSIKSILGVFNPEPVNYKYENKVTGIAGRADLITSVRTIPGVSVGSEAQSGYTVRGGGPDQNIILLDGLPIYETSHLGGLSSLFIPETIKNADFYKAGIPARYGGKLSSVLDVRMKDGHRHDFNRAVSINLENLNGFIEGPISKKSSILINGRISLIDLYAKRLLPKDSDYVNTELNYNDVYAKLSHWFTPSNRLSFTVYSGKDKILLERKQENEALSFLDHNAIRWSNSLFALNYNAALGSNVYLHSNLGISSFDFDSRSANEVSSAENTNVSSLDINTFSAQTDKTAQFNIDIFNTPVGKIKVGMGAIIHNSTPSILEQNTYLQPRSAEGDSTYVSQEAFGFLENSLKLSSAWTINSGIRITNYFGLDTNFTCFQPRLNVQYSNYPNQINIGYSRMSQFLHLLTNAAAGLPNDFWVPSTKEISPETSNLFSASYRYSSNENWSLEIGGFYNSYNNLIEYRNPYELFQGIVSDHIPFNPVSNQTEWTDRVTTGNGRAYGLEFEGELARGPLSLSVAYTLSKSERTFNFGFFSNNEPSTFRYKYDRPHNIASNLQYMLSDNQRINVTWVFGNGNLWTFTENAEPDIEGNPIFIARNRNNRRLSNYHKLGLSYSKEIVSETRGKLEYSIGLHNAYNNKNPFYSYLEENPPEVEDAVSIKEISLFPIFPQFNLKYSW